MPKKLKKKRSQYDVGFEIGYRTGYRDGLDNGRLEGFRMYCVATLYALKDKLHLTDEQMREIHQASKEYVGFVYAGHMSLPQMEKGLKDAYDFQFIWTE